MRFFTHVFHRTHSGFMTRAHCAAKALMLSLKLCGLVSNFALLTWASSQVQTARRAFPNMATHQNEENFIYG